MSHHLLFLRPFAMVFGAACLAAVASAQQPAQPPVDRTAAERQAEINKRPDTPGTGRFAAMKEEIAALPRHVVYRPRDLAALGGLKLGVVAWGNGGCSPDGASSRFHLLEIASHGYLVIASGRILSGPGAPPPEPRPATPPGQPAAPRTLVSDLTDAVDWALAENQRAGSPYFGRIDPAQIAYSGWSCGGLQALQVAKDPRVKTLVIHNSGVLNNGPTTITGMSVGKEVLQTLHTPVIYIQGGPTDIAYANGMDDFNRVAHVPAAIANLPVGHGGTFNEPNGGAAASVAVSWLNWQLRGDTRECEAVRRRGLRALQGHAVVASAQAVPGHTRKQVTRQRHLHSPTRLAVIVLDEASPPSPFIVVTPANESGPNVISLRMTVFMPSSTHVLVKAISRSSLMTTSRDSFPCASPAP